MNFTLVIILGACIICSAAGSGTLAVTWDDCGDASTHAKITSVTPGSITLGQPTTIIGTGNLDEDVQGATFDGVMTGALGIKLLDCSGDASVSKTCALPAGVGTIGFEAMTFPLKAGSVNVKVDLNLSQNLPASLAKTTTKVTATGKNGDKLFCLNVHTAAATSSVAEPPAAASITAASVAESPLATSITTESVAESQLEASIIGSAAGSGTLTVTWDDCGDASTHAKITSVTPRSITLGQPTTIIGTGNLDEDVQGATFEGVMTGALGIKLLDCSGDASVSKTCALPAGVGTIGFEAMTFPLKAGSVNVKVDLNLSQNLPASLAKTTTKVTATGKNGDKLFCLNVHTAAASVEKPTLFMV